MSETAGRRILVAEDNSALATVVRYNLEHAKFKVTTARNGLEAWKLLNAEPFDLVLTDQQMPEMTGSELCHKIRQDPRWQSLPVIMLTAKGLELESSQMRAQFGVQELISKPFSPRDLIAKIEDCLAQAAHAVA